MAEDKLNELPDGFEIDDVQSSELPEGFEIDKTKAKGKINPLLGNMVLGAAGVGAVGLGAAAFNKAKSAFENYRQPFNTRNALVEQLVNEQNQLGLAGQQIYNVPKEYDKRISQVKADKQLQLNQYNLRSAEATKKLTQRLDDFNAQVLNKNLDETTYLIKTQSPQFLKNASDGYASGLKLSEDIMQSRGVKLNTLKFDSDVIEKTLAQLKDSIPEEKLSALKPMLRNVTEAERPLTISQAKSYFNQVAKDLPPQAQIKLSENWGIFLEQNAPKEVGVVLKTLNKEYQPIIQLREKLNSLSKNKFGEFDDAGIYRFLKDYVKKEQDLSTQSLLKLLEEGNNLTSGIEGVGKNIQAVKQAGAKSAGLEKAIQQTGISKQARLREINLQAKAKIDQLTSLQNKATQLVEKTKVAQKLVNARSIQNKISQENILGLRVPRPVKDMAKIGKKSIPMLGIIPQVTSALVATKDPRWEKANLVEKLYLLSGEEIPDYREQII